MSSDQSGTQLSPKDQFGGLFKSLALSEGKSSWQAVSWYSQRDGATHLELRLGHPTETWCHTSCHLVRSADGALSLRTAFSTDVLDYALPADFEPQEAVNEALAYCLETELKGDFAGAGFGQVLLARWAESKARLETCWHEQAKANTGAEKLSNLKEHGQNKPALAAPSTRLGVTRIVGVADDGHGQGFTRVSRYQYKSLKVGYYTHALLARNEDLSASDKMLVLQGGGKAFEEALIAFQAHRKAGWGARRIAFPVAIADAVADAITETHRQFDVTVTFANGDEGQIYASATGSHARYFRLMLERPSEKTNIWVEWNADRQALTIERGSTNERRFKSPDILDSSLRAAIQLLLGVDPVWPSWLEESFSGDYDATHALLDGLDVPARHQGFLGALLGAPYDDAQKAAERFSAQRAKKAQKVASLTFAPDDFPDGTIFGKLARGVGNDKAIFEEGDVSTSI